MAKHKPRRECRCRICQGKLVASSTWYDHNPGAKKKSRPPLPQVVMDAILKRPETNTLPRTRKRHLDEDEDDSPHISKRAAGSSSVRTTSRGNICASIERYLLEYGSRVLVPVQRILANVGRTQK